MRKLKRANCNGKSKTLPQIQGVSKRDAKTKDLKPHLRRVILTKRERLKSTMSSPHILKELEVNFCSVPRRGLYLMDVVSYTGFRHPCSSHPTQVCFHPFCCVLSVVLINVNISLLFLKATLL